MFFEFFFLLLNRNNYVCCILYSIYILQIVCGRSIVVLFVCCSGLFSSENIHMYTYAYVRYVYRTYIAGIYVHIPVFVVVVADDEYTIIK